MNNHIHPAPPPPPRKQKQEEPALPTSTPAAQQADNSQAAQVAIPPDIYAFLDRLITEAGVDPKTEKAKRDEVIHDLFVQLDDHLTDVMIDNMTDEQLEVFTQMNQEKKPQEEIQAYVRKSIPDYEKIFSNAVIEFRDMYLPYIPAPKQQKPANHTPLANK